MIEVALTPADLREADVTVVIDVLRATSTATQALAAGYPAVRCVDSLEHALALRGPGRILAGERRCVTPKGFDQGNSPREARERRGDELVLATTNGAPTAVAGAALSPRVLLACLLNLEAVRGSLRHVARADRRVQIACAGIEGRIAVEDVYVAGRLSASLPGPRDDSARVAEAVAGALSTPLRALGAGAGAAALRAAGLQDDVADCARESRLDVVPRLVDSGPGWVLFGLASSVGGRSLAQAAQRKLPAGRL
ncbi:MAG: 2-phosphosulfolactate phosphatase [Solirubrobacteraceae bacterium]